jgi:3-oxoadipate enol-lactonase
MAVSRVGDVDLHYQLIDCTEPWKAARVPVVFLHGLGGDRRSWLYQVPSFCDAFAVINVDLRGHGDSSAPDGEWSTADMARDVVRLLRNLGAEKAHLVGLSLGGMVALRFALDFPYATESLVLAGTIGGPGRFAPQWRDAVKFIEENPMPAIAKQRIPAAFSDSIDPVMRDYFVDRVSRNDKDAYARTARAIGGFDVVDRLGDIAAPTLVIVGERDAVTPPELSAELAERIANARLVTIAGAGHLCNLERPAEFNRAVREFLLGR